MEANEGRYQGKSTESMRPSVGRVVHYVAGAGYHGGEFPAGVCRAAIITEVSSDGFVVGLCVLNPTCQYFIRRAVADFTQNQPGTWHWPERV